MFHKIRYLCLISIMAILSNIAFASTEPLPVNVDKGTNDISSADIPILVEEVQKSLITTETPEKTKDSDVLLKGDVNVVVENEAKTEPELKNKKKKEKTISEYDKKFAGKENTIIVRKKPYYNLLASFNPDDILIEPETNTVAKDDSFRPDRHIIAVAETSAEIKPVEIKEPVTAKKITFQKKVKTNIIATAPAPIVKNNEPQIENEKPVKQDNAVISFFKKSFNFIKKKFRGLFKKNKI